MQWSSPQYRLDSPGALESLANLRSIGANSLELVVQWYFGNINDTSAYAITDSTNPMRTSTDAELEVFIAAARAMGMRVVLSPMLDPDWTDPRQFGCRAATRTARQLEAVRGPVPPGCYWRGDIGHYWRSADDICTTGPWAAWHDSYSAFILHYAALAARAGADGFLVAHELENPIRHCARRWQILLNHTRNVFTGSVSVAVLPDSFDVPNATIAWLSRLDWVGVDCYIGGAAPAPAMPWEDATLDELIEGVTTNARPVAAFAARVGRQVACTEVGWITSPWASETGWGTLLDPASQDVAMLDVNGASQALAYAAFVRVFEAAEWYAGTFFWLWRADPTAGGPSDASPVVWGKPAAVTLISLWQGA